MSAEATPVLAGSIRSFKLFMTQWEALAVKCPCLKRFVDISLVWAQKYYSRMDGTKAYIIAMRTSLITI
jgi:hypothetical protein